MRGLGLVVFAGIAVLIGVAATIMFIKKKRRDRLDEYDDFDAIVDDEEFEHFFGVDQSESDEDES